MNPSTNAAHSFPESSLPTGLSDDELLAATRSLIGRSNQLLATLLAHLGEVEARGIHRTRACSSLYAYCIYELRLSEDEAFRRVTAARLVRRFPSLLGAVAAGELHLTGLLMLGPHLSDENLTEVLARAKHRTKKEIARLVRLLDPLPDVPPRIEPLGPAPARLVPEAPTWSEFARSMSPVRELTPGERPRDWAESIAESVNDIDVPEAPEEPAPARLEPQRYKVQFTASDEYVNLVEEAQALLSHSDPRATIDEIQLRAMRVLVAELKRQKYAVTARPRKRSRGTPQEHETQEHETQEHADRSSRADERVHEHDQPRRRGRYVPAAVRRAVFERDAGRCTYAHTSAGRCRETQGLELHHLTPFAEGGEHTQDNLTLRCRAHNALAAEEDFGRDLIELRRGSNEHEPWATPKDAVKVWRS
jgi:5-methylcytosine-specific restriction endonuclease McrA